MRTIFLDPDHREIHKAANRAAFWLAVLVICATVTVLAAVLLIAGVR